VLTTRQALTGPWAASARSWGSTLVPGTLIVVMQELPTGYPNGWFIALSALLQFLIAGAWVGLVAAVGRRLTGEVPPVALAVAWLGVGVGRALVGGAVALAAGLDPEWTFRIVFWCAVTLLWTPLLTYALAQAEEYRRLLAQRTRLEHDLDELLVRAHEGAAERAARAGDAIADALGPALDEVRAGLLTARFDPVEIERIRRRLDELSRRTRDFTTPPVFEPAAPRMRSSVVAAMSSFQVERPVFAGVLTAAAVAPVLALAELRVGGILAAAEMLVGVAIATLGFILVSVGVSRLHTPRLTRFVVLRVGTFLAGVVGALTIAFLPWSWLPDVAFLALAATPFLFSAAADILSTAVGLEATGTQLAAAISRDESLVQALRTELHAEEEQASAELLEFVRGEISGRLASCALALAYLDSGDLGTADRARILVGIADQLDQAAARLQELRP